MHWNEYIICIELNILYMHRIKHTCIELYIHAIKCNELNTYIKLNIHYTCIEVQCHLHTDMYF